MGASSGGRCTTCRKYCASLQQLMDVSAWRSLSPESQSQGPRAVHSGSPPRPSNLSHTLLPTPPPPFSSQTTAGWRYTPKRQPMSRFGTCRWTASGSETQPSLVQRGREGFEAVDYDGCGGGVRGQQPPHSVTRRGCSGQGGRRGIARPSQSWRTLTWRSGRPRGAIVGVSSGKASWCCHGRRWWPPGPCACLGQGAEPHCKGGTLAEARR